MPDLTYVRVLDKSTGHEYSERRHVVDGAPDAYDVLDKPAVDANDRLLAPEFNASSPEPAGYAAQTVADLKAEIDGRNEGRSEDTQIPAQGNKPDLIAALEADDNKEN